MKQIFVEKLLKYGGAIHNGNISEYAIIILIIMNMINIESIKTRLDIIQDEQKILKYELNNLQSYNEQIGVIKCQN